SGAAHATAVGNAYAALTELNHFCTPGTIFSANYDYEDTQVGGPIIDPDAPFARCILLAMPNDTDGASPKGEAAAKASAARTPQSSLDLISHFLVSDLTTSLGRCADISRRERWRANDWPSLICQTFGMHRVIWPRKALLHEAGRHLCRNLVTRWLSKDATPFRAEVQEWVSAQWTRLALSPEQLIAELQQACEQALGKAPESAFAELIDSIASWQTAHPGKEMELAPVFDKLGQLEKWFGRPPQPAPKDKKCKAGREKIPEEGLRTAVLLMRGTNEEPLLEEALRAQADALTAAR